MEAMLEMRPGIGIDRFIGGFIRESKTKIHPWMSEYDRSAKPEPDPEKEAERHMLAALREVAKTRVENLLRGQTAAAHALEGIAKVGAALLGTGERSEVLCGALVVGR